MEHAEPAAPEEAAPGLSGAAHRWPGRGRLYAGTSGFAYPDWAPRFYPPQLPSSSRLRAYAERLAAVELNNTFYRRPTEASVRRWLAATPESFRFCPKAQRGSAWRAWSGQDQDASIAWLADSLRGFGSRLGCVLMAVPPTMQRDDPALLRVLEAWPADLPLAVELPHPSWADDAVHAHLDTHGAALVAVDRDEDDEPDLRRIGGCLYLRLRRTAYDESDLVRWARRLQPFLADGSDAFVFFRHDADGTSALLAERLLQLAGGLRTAGVGSSMGDTPHGPSASPRRHASMNATAVRPEAEAVVADLQSTLVELLDLSLLGKQAHWNVVGPNFRSIHLQLDEIVDAARLSADNVAERIATIGAVPDGRAAAIASTSGLPDFPSGHVAVKETVQKVGATLDTMTERMRERIQRMGDPDPLSQDILIETAEDLEKQAWMLRAQLEY